MNTLSEDDVIVFALLIGDLQQEFQQDPRVAGISSLESDDEAAASRGAQGMITLQSLQGTAVTETSKALPTYNFVRPGSHLRGNVYIACEYGPVYTEHQP